MSALFYLEWRYAVNQFRAILRSPQRLIVWTPYVFFVLYFGYVRILSQHGGRSSFAIVPPFAVAVAGGYVALLGATIAFAASGRVAAFRSPAEAVLFSNAGVPPMTIAVWLQLRKLAASPMRWIGGFLYLFAFAAPRDTGPLAIVRALFVVGMLIALAMGTELPVFLLARGRLQTPLRSFGWVLVGLGSLYGIAGIIGPRALRPLHAITHFAPGSVVRALLQGNAYAMAALVIGIAGLAACILFLGNDAMPELYAASQGQLANRSRRTRVGRRSYVLTEQTAATRIPSGALTLVWKDWITFLRGKGIVRLWIVGGIAWTCAGVATGVAKLYFSDASPVLTLLGCSAVLLVVVAPLNASAGLALDLSKPLFWLNADPLRLRIAAWSGARSWRAGIALGLAPAAAGLVAGDYGLALLAIPFSVVAYWSLQALGVGLYALFPDPIDSRGPMLLVRLFVTGLYVAPATLAYAIVSISTGLDGFAVLLAAIILLLQGYGVVEVASYRFKEYGATLATAARAT